MPARRRLLAVTAVACAVTVAACGSSSGSRSGSSTSTATKATTTTTAACAGAGWTDVSAAWRTLAAGPFASGRQQVAEDLAALRRGQDTSEVGQVTVADVGTGEPLVVVLSETGGPDIEVTRVDTEITLEGGDQGWSLTTARQRSICAGATG